MSPAQFPLSSFPTLLPIKYSSPELGAVDPVVNRTDTAPVLAVLTVWEDAFKK